ncbi:unnamed protein product, partial [Didymodactylos carnosus]
FRRNENGSLVHLKFTTSDDATKDDLKQYTTIYKSMLLSHE